MNSNLIKFKKGDRCFLDNSKNRTLSYVVLNEPYECKKTATFVISQNGKVYTLIVHPNNILFVTRKGRSTVLAQQSFDEKLETKEYCEQEFNAIPLLAEQGEKSLRALKKKAKLAKLGD